MIVRLSHYGWHSVRHRVSDFHGQQMKAHRVRRGRSMHDYELPAIAWRQILDEMVRVCYGPMGGKLDRGVPQSAYTAIRRIADAVRRMENHPALYGRGVEGWVGDIIPAFQTEDGWSPYPSGGAFVLLGPAHQVVNEMQVTTWAPLLPGTAPHAPSFDEAWHAMFIGRSVQAERLAGEHDVDDLVVGEPVEVGSEVVDVEDHRRP